VNEERGNLLLVGLKLVEAVPDVSVLVGGVLQGVRILMQSQYQDGNDNGVPTFH